MSTKKGTKKPAVTSPEETAAAAALEKHQKALEGKTLTDAQKVERKALTEALGKLKFVRIANKRLPRARAAIKGLANLAGKAYVKSAPQIKAICDVLESDVRNLRAALSGTKAGDDFKLPGFEEAPAGGEKK